MSLIEDMDDTNTVIFICVVVLLLCAYLFVWKCSKYCMRDQAYYREETSSEDMSDAGRPTLTSFEDTL